MRKIASLLLVLALCAACGDAPPQRLIRLGSLIKAGAAEAVMLPAGAAVAGSQPYETRPGLSAARTARLRLRARGDASLATLTWRLAQDRGFPQFRTLSFPVVPDGQEHVYTVDLEREAYWTGRVEALRLTVDRGRLDLLEITGEPAADAYRSMSLRGESLPALPGLGRIEIDLPRDLPRRAVFESRLGLVPEFDRPGVKAVFRARLAGGDGKPWLEETVEGSQEKSGAGWH
ncbi:MAG TPA: hypothetical protein VHU81_13815, partial [Thermoanaerobaculia bacterium]|nr:hypothetical protein [Thermoanaerobaculia bacterium]